MFPHANKRLLRSVVLQHQTRQDTHYDWLIAGLTTDAARCLTFRVKHPPAHWPVLGKVLAEHLPDHRKHYLTYQGPVAALADDPSQTPRGKVRHIEQGCVLVQMRADARLVMKVDWRSGRLELDLHRLKADRWQIQCGRAQKRDAFL